MRMIKNFILLICLIPILSGCHHTQPLTKKQTLRLYIQAEKNIPSEWSVPVTLPISKKTFRLFPKPVITEELIDNIELIQTDFGKCIQLSLTPNGTESLHNATLNNYGKVLVLLENNQALGFRPIESPIDKNVVMIFIEVPDIQLPSVVSQLKSCL